MPFVLCSIVELHNPDEVTTSPKAVHRVLQASQLVVPTRLHTRSTSKVHVISQSAGQLLEWSAHSGVSSPFAKLAECLGTVSQSGTMGDVVNSPQG
jgi:hypothetical protein